MEQMLGGARRILQLAPGSENNTEDANKHDKDDSTTNSSEKSTSLLGEFENFAENEVKKVEEGAKAVETSIENIFTSNSSNSTSNDMEIVQPTQNTSISDNKIDTTD